MSGPGGRDRRRDPKRKDRDEEMKEMVQAAREGFAPLASALGELFRAITDGVRPTPVPPRVAPVAPPPVAEEPPPPVVEAPAAAKPRRVKPAGTVTAPEEPRRRKRPRPAEPVDPPPPRQKKKAAPRAERTPTARPKPRGAAKKRPL